MITSKIAFREIVGGYKKLIVFYLCVFLSVGVIMTVAQLSENLSQKINYDAKKIFGGDIKVTNVNYALREQEIELLKQFGKVSYNAQLRAMAKLGESFRVVELKGVDKEYPLLGVVSTENNTAMPLSIGEAIVGQELKVTFDINIGDIINLGGIDFKVVDFITAEPDWLVSSLRIGPKVIANVESLEQAKLLIPGSLVQYNYTIILNNQAELQNTVSEIKEKIPQAFTTDYIKGSTAIQNSISRLEFFLMLAAISNLMICGVGIAVSTKRFLETKSVHIAILKSIGASKSRVLSCYAQLLALLTIDAATTAAIVSSLVCYFLVPYLNHFVELDIDFTFYWMPILKGYIFGLVAAFCFAMPALISSISIKPATLFRSFSPLLLLKDTKSLAIYFIFGIFLFIAILINASDTVFATLYVCISMVAIASFFYVAKLIQSLASKLRSSKPWVNLALKNLHRPQSPLPTIIVSLSLSLTVLISLQNVDYNMKTLLEESIPSKAPSLFLIDINKSDYTDLFKLLTKYDGISDIVFKPSVQGLITKVNGVPVEKIKIDESAKWAVGNHRRLSYANIKPDNNDIVMGKWWEEGYHGEPLVSVDQRIFNGMHLSLGDKITFNIGGDEITAKVANTRKIDYTTFNINFAFILSPNVIESFPLSFFATLKAPDKETEFKILGDVAKQFPTVISIRTDEGLDEAYKQITNIIIAIDIIVIVSLVAGFIVLIGAFLATEESRKYDTVVFKMLGSTKAYIMRGYLFEWALATLLSCLVAAFAGSIGGYLILEYYTDFTNKIAYQEITEIIGFTLIIVLLTVIATNYRILSTKPMEILKNE